MGLRGPAPKSAAIKRLRGNPGGRKLVDDQPKPDGTIPTCPDWLRGEAVTKWEQLAPQLHACGILANIDGDVLATYCQAWARWKEAEEMVGKSSQILKSAEGSIYINPALGASSMAIKQMLACMTKLGLSPTDRARLKVDAPIKETSLAEMLFNQAKRKK